jgi:uncharacterized protein with ParB-like and HNH nuclease domain
MKASETHLGKILEGTNQFIVPLFQRPYTWEESRWKVLWSDLVELCEDEMEASRAKPHFLGSIVTVPTRSVPEGVTKYLLIDGQQRITTLQILLAALRDRTRGSVGNLAERLDKSHLVNQFEEGNDHFKLLPTQTNGDRSAFLAVINGEAPLGGTSRITKAYVWFQKRLNSRNCPDPERLAGAILRRLSLVSIVLDPDDNPHLIFESLNYKGEPLTQGDLIRNYFLMRVPAAQQEKLFRHVWEPIQLRLREQLSEFVRHFLMRQGSLVKQGEIYRTLKEQTDDQAPDEVSHFLEEMHRSAINYHSLLDPSQEKNPELAARLRRFQRLDVGVSWPFLLNLYAVHEAGALTIDQFCKILDTLENFFVRRFICGIPTHGLNKIFPSLYNQARTWRTCDSLVEGVQAILLQRDYPPDSSFSHALVNVRLYGTGERLPKARLVLESLERALGGKEQVIAESLTVEHIMPQTLTAWWQEHLGESWREVHETRLHCLGNLTLTGYNAELSNSDFTSKRTVFLNSPIYLSRSIARADRWDDTAIQQRGEELANLALSVWPYFGPRESPSMHLARSSFTGRTPSSVIAFGKQQNVETWREVLQVTLEAVRDASPDEFDGIADKFPRLLSTKPDTFRTPRPLAKSDIYFETNLSAASVVRYCQQIIDTAGYSSSEWSVNVR